MNQKVLGDFVKKMLLVMIGFEVVENVVKIVCVVIKCSGTIVFSGVYYGCMYYMLVLIGKVNLYFVGMGLMLGYVYCVFYFCLLYGISEDDVIVSIYWIFKNDVVLEDIVVIVIELVQGEGGFYVLLLVFMQCLCVLCDEYGIMLIVDEVQSGVGCIGMLFVMEQMGVVLDFIIFVKLIVGGFLLVGVIGCVEVMDVVVSGGLGGIYVGNLIVCVVVLEVLKVFEQENLL